MLAFIATLSVNCNRSTSSVSQLMMPSSLSNSSLAQNILTNSSTTNGNMSTNLISAKTSPVYRPMVVNNNANQHQTRPTAFSLPSHTPPTLSSSVTNNTMEKQQIAEEDWLRVEQREILKQLLAEQRLNKVFSIYIFFSYFSLFSTSSLYKMHLKTIGSSPEIHMLGMNNNSGNKDNRTRNVCTNNHANGKNYMANSNLMKKAFHPHFKFNTNGILTTSGTTDYSVNSPTNSNRSTNYSDEKVRNLISIRLWGKNVLKKLI